MPINVDERTLAITAAPTAVGVPSATSENHSGIPSGAAEGRPEPILLGRHVIDAGLLRPGPKLGALLRGAYQAQIDGAFATVEEGLEWATREINHEGHEGTSEA